MLWYFLFCNCTKALAVIMFKSLDCIWGYYMLLFKLNTITFWRNLVFDSFSFSRVPVLSLQFLAKLIISILFDDFIILPQCMAMTAHHGTLETGSRVHYTISALSGATGESLSRRVRRNPQMSDLDYVNKTNEMHSFYICLFYNLYIHSTCFRRSYRSSSGVYVVYCITQLCTKSWKTCPTA